VEQKESKERGWGGKCVRKLQRAEERCKLSETESERERRRVSNRGREGEIAGN